MEHPVPDELIYLVHEIWNYRSKIIKWRIGSMFQNFQQVNKNGDGFKKFAYFNNFSEITDEFLIYLVFVRNLLDNSNPILSLLFI